MLGDEVWGGIRDLVHESSHGVMRLPLLREVKARNQMQQNSKEQRACVQSLTRSIRSDRRRCRHKWQP